ncbi:MAG: sodium-translocating pyrophosphatase [Puniceicoccales bacterium]|jgi:K(+)-stimulated pyrophosphate-energized sodium pump|nr:sodium-translocating pyrophosphatase [Puniceicoccales bacterium]
MTGIFWFVPLAAIIALCFARYFFTTMKKTHEGNATMIAIASRVREGAMAYLKQQYKVVFVVFLVVGLMLAFFAYVVEIQNRWVPLAFMTAGFCSALAGFFGMRTATAASSRTAHAASNSLNAGLRVAFRSGAVMGLVVVGLALLDYSFWYFILNWFIDLAKPSAKILAVTSTMLTFAVGASLQALFARVGGGIFTKAADVGADLVGKVEAGIPEDDIRNPAVIADNVGDNVGDVAGMGADLYESYSGSILAAASLGAVAFRHMGAITQLHAVLTPVLICALGVLASIVGVFFVKTEENSSSLDLLRSLFKGIKVSSIIICVGSYLILKLLGIPNAIGIWGSIMVGLLMGMLIGEATEYFTSQAHKPTKKIAEYANTGAATVVIAGFGNGMISTLLPVLAVTLGMICSYHLAVHGSDGNTTMGLYGVAISAVGMLSTLGITLATDAYGPIADNAGGNAEMSKLGAHVRARTDALDALGNTTAATGKGFAIGSAALTALALIASYVEGVKLALINAGGKYIVINGVNIALKKATMSNVLHAYDVNLLNPKVMIGMFIGSMLTFLFCGLTVNSVGRAAAKMVTEVRRQFHEIKGIMSGETVPDYTRCVTIATSAAQREMLFPAIIAIVSPIVVGLLFGIPGVLGLLGGALSSGFVLAVFLSNAGGSWDNAKKYIEEGAYGGKGSDAHKATVVGDTVGDPFKDTAGPSLNILIKLMTIMSVITVGLAVSYSLF